MKWALTSLLVLSTSSAAFAQDSAQAPRILTIAHRGASALAPENTIAAFRKAIELHANAVECDIHQTKDGHLVLLHDDRVNRTTNGSGSVAKLSLEEIRALDAGSWFNTDYAAERIPTLEDLILLDSTVLLILEPKHGSDVYPGIEARIVEAVRKHNAEGRTILKSFDTDVLGTFAMLAPEIPRLYVFVGHLSWLSVTIDRGISFGDVLDLDVQWLQVWRPFASRSFIEKAHASGKKVVVWGVHEKEDIEEAIRIGADGLESDYPDRVDEALRKMQGSPEKQ
jgi:glycerophosphoryl diester phosphodiesterase